MRTGLIAGLKVGRTPEYLGKKTEAYDVRTASIAVLIFPLMILTFMTVSGVVPEFAAAWNPEDLPNDWRELRARWDKFHHVRIGLLLGYVLPSRRD